MSTFYPRCSAFSSRELPLPTYLLHRAVLQLCRRQCSPGDYSFGHVGAMTLKNHARAVIYALQRVILSTIHLWQTKYTTTPRTTRSMKMVTISNIEDILRHMQVDGLLKDDTICAWKRAKPREYKIKIRGLKFESCTTSRSWRTNVSQATHSQSVNEADLKDLL